MSLTTLREYWLILILLLAAITTLGVSYGNLLVNTVEQSISLLEVRR